MVSLSFNIQLVVLVIAFLILQQQQQTSANALFGKLRKKEFITLQKDHDSVIDTGGGIRKMLVYQFSIKVVKQEKMTDDISVTGDGGFDSMKTYHMNAQVDSQIFKKNHERSKKKESKELVDHAEDEIAKLMNKDYTGKSRPRRSKPPINNHKPTD